MGQVRSPSGFIRIGYNLRLPFLTSDAPSRIIIAIGNPCITTFIRLGNSGGVISKFLLKTGAMVRDLGLLYKPVAQTVLIYEINSWVVTGAMLKLLEGFHHWSARKILGMTS